MKEEFKKWLINNGYTENTSVSYSNSINRVSDNEGVDVYKLNDLTKIKELVEAYSTTGEFSEIGYEGNGAVRNAVKAYYRYKKELLKDEGEVSFEYSDDELADQIVHGYSYKGNLRKSLIKQIHLLYPDYELLKRDSIENVYLSDDSCVDLLLEKNNNDLLVVRLEPGVACINIFGEIATCVGSLMSKFPGKNIKGCIIAGEIDDNLRLASKVTNVISLKTYKMNLELIDL